MTPDERMDPESAVSDAIFKLADVQDMTSFDDIRVLVAEVVKECLTPALAVLKATPPICETCGRRKRPRGREPFDPTWCGPMCAGYEDDPVWVPSRVEEFGTERKGGGQHGNDD